MVDDYKAIDNTLLQYTNLTNIAQKKPSSDMEQTEPALSNNNIINPASEYQVIYTYFVLYIKNITIKV